MSNDHPNDPNYSGPDIQSWFERPHRHEMAYDILSRWRALQDEFARDHEGWEFIRIDQLEDYV